MQINCPSCGSSSLSTIYSLSQAPVHSVLVLRSPEEALQFPRGDIRLAFCHACGFITNQAYDAGLQEYSERCEESQGFSETFNTFHRQLAAQLIDRYDLRRKRVIEIGCGKGEFLALLAEMGENEGVGFDPAYVPGRFETPAAGRLKFIKDFYSEQYSGFQGDFYCCKMTLEHIANTGEFTRMLRRTIGDQPNAVVFFQVPDVGRILREQAFWDIYYEHCSYFSPGSLARLFRSAGFKVTGLWKDYADQYIMIEARPGSRQESQPQPIEESVAELAAEAAEFTRRAPRRIQVWKERLRQYRKDGRKVILWGSGSKGVAFLTTLGVQGEIAFTVDINPFKHCTYMAGTGHQVILPDHLDQEQPDIVIIMNPVYRQEIQRTLEAMNLFPEIITVDD